jgi:hypothetical protein
MQKTVSNDALLADAGQEAARIGAADIVLGVPTYNNHESISRIAEAGLAALTAAPASLRVAIINADGASKDGTPELIRELVGERVPLIQVAYPMYPVHKLSTPLVGVPGGREAALAIFRLARQLGAKACALVDAEVESITPDWIARLLDPILDDAVDMVAPCYLRHKFDGLINTAIRTPYARALYGKRLRQPTGADLGLSAALMDFHLGLEAAQPNGASAFNPWSAIPAICHGFRVGQTFLGPRVVKSREASPDLSSTLRHVLAALFDYTERTAAVWQKVRGSEPVPWFGPPLVIDDTPSDVNKKPAIDSFRLGCQDLMEIWSLILPPATLLDVRRLARQGDDAFRFPDEVWVRVVYDFALGHHARTLGRDHLLQAITPLYLGWVGSFTGEMRDAQVAGVEERLEQLAMGFEAQKRYLISRWRWPDRFNP